ncbi:hypothetical protein KR009_006102 [Drosophila setifemur]|nr:hypothetical protein KR009_006102 [Drosophila setifemur]
MIFRDTAPVVQTTHGKVRGTRLKSLYDEQFYAFDGIPYAEPPLGDLRFKEPREVKPWSGILDCSQPRDKCLQPVKGQQVVEGSENCLYLNVSVKSLQSEKPLPVMVYIHGGAFSRGDASRRATGPDYLVNENVVHISIAYRLGRFGFLSFADPSLEVPGNAGLKDIILALRWIKENAANFNGDPERITLFGHSSGSMTVQLLLASPQTERLFHKAILMAGYSMELSRLPQMEFRLAKHLGYEGENIDGQVLEFLVKADPQLLASADILTAEEKAAGLLLDFSPSVECYATPGAVLLAEPIELLRTSWSNRIPIVLGTTSEDGLYYVVGLKKDPALLQEYQQHPERVLPWTLKQRCDLDKQRRIVDQLLEHFCGANSQQLTMDHADALAKLFTHNLVHEQDRFIKSRLAHGQAQTYLYRFAFDSPDYNFYRIRALGRKHRGVCHVDELGYIFVMPDTFKLDRSRAEFKTICRMVAMWVSFAATSNPNAPLTKPLVQWKSVTSTGTRMLLNISEELNFIPQPEMSKLKLYDLFYEQTGLPLF